MTDDESAILDSVLDQAEKYAAGKSTQLGYPVGVMFDVLLHHIRRLEKVIVAQATQAAARK